MKADGTPETEFEASMPLFGQIIEANVRSLQYTNDQLLANKEAELRVMQQQFFRLYRSMEKVAERTDSATAYAAIERFYHVFTDVEKDLAKTPEQY